MSERSQQTAAKPTMLTVEQAMTLLLDAARPLTAVESVGLTDAPGRMLAAPQYASIDVPGFDNSSMDGVAIRAADVPASGATLLMAQRIAAGAVGESLPPGQAARLFTGAPLPDGADAVVMQEDCVFGDGEVTIAGPVETGQHVRPRGNNVCKGAQVLAAGTRLRPQDIALAAAVGISTLPVIRPLKVAFFSSGDELVEPGDDLAPGQIYNSNRYALSALLRGLGCVPLDLGIVEDDFAATRDLLAKAADSADLVISSGGVSVGEEDHIKAAIEAIGELTLWNIAVKPGKPVAFGRIGDADFLGLPGNPVSTLVTFCMFARPFILTRQGAVDVLPTSMPVRAEFEWPKPMRRREFVRVRVTANANGELSAELFERQGSDVLSSTVWASGLVEIPEGTIVDVGDVVAYLSFEQLLT